MHDYVGAIEVVNQHKRKEHCEEPARNVVSPVFRILLIYPQEREYKSKEQLTSIKICC